MTEKTDRQNKKTEEVKDSSASETEKVEEKKEITGEDNVITPDDLQKLEKEERKKKGILDRIFNKKPPAFKIAEQESMHTLEKHDEEKRQDHTSLSELKRELESIRSELNKTMMNNEKLEGKMESERAVTTGIEERMSQLSEQIGELRSMILDRERSYNEIDAGFKKIEAITEEIQPAMIKKDFDKKERQIVELSVNVERVNAMICEANKQVKQFREQMDKIKSLDNLLKVSKNIEENISKIKDTEKYTGRMAAKTEELFTELDKRISRFASQTAKIESLDELSMELVKSLDKNEIKLKEAVFKEDLEKLKNTITSSIKEDVKKITELTSEQKSKESELSNIKSEVSSLQDSFKELKISQNSLLSATNAKTTEKTKELKNNIAQMANILSIIQKKEHISKQDIDNLKKEINKKINEIAEMRQKDYTTQQKTKKEMELLKKTEQDTREKLKKELTEKINELNRNIKYTSSTITNLQDNMKYMEDSRNAMKQPPSKQAIDTIINPEINEKTKELKNNISQMANILSMMQKKEHISKQDINNLKKETKKEMELLKKAEEDTRENLRKEFTEKITERNTNTKHTSSTIEYLQDNMKYMEDSIKTMKQPLSKQSINTKANIHSISLNKNTIPDTKKTAIDNSNKAKHKSIKKGISQMSYEELLNEDINQLLYQNATPVYDHDLRLNKVIRLIDKTEELLDKNNLKDAKKTYSDLISAYNTIYKKVPKSQIDEIYPLIEQLHNKLKSAPS